MNEIIIELEHITLGALSFGSPDKPLLLALHGWLDNAASFIPLAQHLEDYHVLAVEWPGHGHSGHKTDDASYPITDYVYDLYALSQYIEQHYNCKQLDIIGHSMGGIVASIFAGTFSERVNNLILIESFGPLSANVEQTGSNLKKAILQRGRRGKKGKPIHPTMDSAVTARTDAGDFSRDIGTLLVQRGIVAVNGGYTWRSDARLRALSPIRMTEPQAQDLLSSITAPVLLILGQSGLPFAKESMEKRLSIVNQVTTLDFSGGHHVHMEIPSKIASSIVKFINKQ